MDIAQRLRSAIAADHEHTEHLPLAQEMAHGTIERSTYLMLLGQLWHLHDAVEPMLADCPDLVGLYGPAMARRDVLARDLATLGGTVGPLLPATREVMADLGELRHRPGALLGVLYVLEGSRMGSMVLAGSLARALGIRAEPGQGLDYHVEGLAERPRLWRESKARMLALPLDAAAQDAAVAGAVMTMQGLGRVFAAVPLPVAEGVGR